MIPLAEAEVQLRFLLVCLVSPAVTSVQPAIDIMRTEQKLQPVVAQLELKPSQPLPERDNDWFVMFEAFREEPVKFPAGIQPSYTRMSRKLLFCINLLALSSTHA